MVMKRGKKSSLIPINPTISKEKRDRVSIPNLLNPKILPLQPSEFACNNNATSISDDESEVVKTNTIKNSTENTEKGLLFESVYGSMPERISCAGITFDKTKFLSVLSSKSWVFDSVISAFLMLFNQDSVFALDTAFLTVLPQAIRNKYISTHAEFLAFSFGCSLNNKISKLKTCQTVLLPVFNTKLTKKISRQKINEGNHSGLGVLGKNYATLRLLTRPIRYIVSNT